jgi:hypothetical protein
MTPALVTHVEVVADELFALCLTAGRRTRCRGIYDCAGNWLSMIATADEQLLNRGANAQIARATIHLARRTSSRNLIVVPELDEP